MLTNTAQRAYLSQAGIFGLRPVWSKILVVWYCFHNEAVKQLHHQSLFWLKQLASNWELQAESGKCIPSETHEHGVKLSIVLILAVYVGLGAPVWSQLQVASIRRTRQRVDRSLYSPAEQEVLQTESSTPGGSGCSLRVWEPQVPSFQAVLARHCVPRALGLTGQGQDGIQNAVG